MTNNIKQASAEADGWVISDYQSELESMGDTTILKTKRANFNTPVCLISPAQKARMEALETWASRAYKFLDEHKQETEAGDLIATRLFEDYGRLPKAEGIFRDEGGGEEHFEKWKRLKP